MRVIKFLFAATPLAALFVLAACAGSAPSASQPAAPIATNIQVAEMPVVQVPTQDATATPASEPDSTQAAPSAPGEVSFSRDILPILQSHCINCHGGQRTSEGLDLKTYEDLMAGSKNGSVVTTGDAARSLFVTLAVEGKMPKRGPKLTPDQIKLLTDWVNAGAPNN